MIVNKKNITETDFFSNEFRLILALCQLDDLKKEAMLESVSLDDILWDTFYNLSKEHKLDHQVYNSLNLVQKSVPNYILNKFKFSKQQQVKRQLLLTSQLVRVTEQLDKKNIKYISFKGPILSQSLFDDCISRNSKDLDILIDLEDFINCHQTLLSLGFESKVSSILHKKKTLDLYKKTYYEATYKHKDLGVYIEVHWATGVEWLTKSTVKELLSRAIEVEIQGRLVKTFTELDNAFYLIAHGIKHRWFRLFWCFDLAYLLKQKPNLHQLFLAEIENHPSKKFFLSAIYFANQLLGAQLPVKLKDKQQLLFVNNLNMYFIKGIKYINAKNSKLLIIKVFFNTFLINKKLKKVRTLPEVLSENLDLLDYKIPDKFYFLFYVIRPFSLLARKSTNFIKNRHVE